MTNTNVAATKPLSTMVDESPSLLRAWCMNKNLQYNFAMNFVMIIINIEAILYIRNHENHAIENVLASKAYFVGRICHTFGFCIFVDLLYSVSPHLALYFGLPCLLGFVAVMIAPSCPYLWKGLCNKVQELRDWWKHVNRPQSSVVIVQGSPFLRCEF
ncbi:unnamed protein product [Arabidopsis thaliana]|uniref:(thale cress) hypothetical protein n=1 Tax=Arabidopsis thaliana TaxID=3702 RepID=A0A7G2FBW1_ARATH|nr:unnamed protein product [Arabidopsis thaliana]